MPRVTELVSDGNGIWYKKFGFQRGSPENVMRAKASLPQLLPSPRAHGDGFLLTPALSPPKARTSHTVTPLVPCMRVPGQGNEWGWNPT